MKVSYKWLKEYLDLSDVTPEELAEKMSRTGIEVDDVIYPGKGFVKNRRRRNVVSGRPS